MPVKLSTLCLRQILSTGICEYEFFYQHRGKARSQNTAMVRTEALKHNNMKLGETATEEKEGPSWQRAQTTSAGFQESFSFSLYLSLILLLSISLLRVAIILSCKEFNHSLPQCFLYFECRLSPFFTPTFFFFCRLNNCEYDTYHTPDGFNK